VSLSFRAGGRTDCGPHREANDDYLLLDPALGLFAVFDAGGSWSEMGARAGRVSAEVIQRVIRDGEGEGPRALIEQAFRTASETLQAEPDDNGWCGGSSVSLVMLRSDRVFVSWLGDAMAYRVTDERIEPLTRPHTIWDEMVRRGNTPTNTGWRNILMHVLGGELPNPLEVISFVPLPGDCLVLTTDGIANHIPESTILNACRTVSDPTTCAEAIIEHAVMAGSRDNCTCAVMAFDCDGPEPEPELDSHHRKSAASGGNSGSNGPAMAE
jgi:serine/threonine protein phosphatase PrpC